VLVWLSPGQGVGKKERDGAGEERKKSVMPTRARLPCEEEKKELEITVAAFSWVAKRRQLRRWVKRRGGGRLISQFIAKIKEEIFINQIREKRGVEETGKGESSVRADIRRIVQGGNRTR